MLVNVTIKLLMSGIKYYYKWLIIQRHMTNIKDKMDRSTNL